MEFLKQVMSYFLVENAHTKPIYAEQFFSKK